MRKHLRFPSLFFLFSQSFWSGLLDREKMMGIERFPEKNHHSGWRPVRGHGRRKMEWDTDGVRRTGNGPAGAPTTPNGRCQAGATRVSAEHKFMQGRLGGCRGRVHCSRGVREMGWSREGPGGLRHVLVPVGGWVRHLVP
ncbi:hypothetical protein EV126DRAFT_406503 [Verticillium dahliae]|nr:hypothetical protein EV126DRAFT_406503 [Verticillium dahliae]